MCHRKWKKNLNANFLFGSVKNWSVLKLKIALLSVVNEPEPFPIVQTFWQATRE